MKNSKGITLIALVITIIVLLILAGVSISAIIGENGIVTKAKESKIKNEQGNVMDGMILKSSEFELYYQTEDGTNNDLLEYLKSENYINENLKVNITEFLGENSETGNGESNDIYTIEEQQGEYYLVYINDKNIKIELGKLGEKKQSNPNLFEVDENGVLTIKNYYDYYNYVMEWEEEYIVIPKEVDGRKVKIIKFNLIHGPIGTRALEEVKSIKIPNGVMAINEFCFSGMYQLESIEISDTVEYIGTRAFEENENIESIVIPDSVTEMGRGVFEGWTSSQTIYVPFKEGEQPEGWDINWNINCDATIVYVQ